MSEQKGERAAAARQKAVDVTSIILEREFAQCCPAARGKRSWMLGAAETNQYGNRPITAAVAVHELKGQETTSMWCSVYPRAVRWSGSLGRT